MVECVNCGGTDFERKIVTKLHESEMRWLFQQELLYPSLPEFRYFCLNCGLEYEGIRPT